MAFTQFTIIVALGALITGSMNTLTNNLACMQSAVGTMAPSTIWGKLNKEDQAQHLFDHPFLLCWFMFLGEFLCIFAHAVTRSRSSRDVGRVQAQVQKGSFWFAIPACCDILGTGTMYAGLCLSSASVFQMLRGSVVIFTAVLSVVWLKRKIYVYQWFSVVLLVIGITIVGLVSLKNLPEGKDETGVAIGNVLIVLAQIITATQMCIEEKIMSIYHTPALKVVGLEGTFGLLFLGILLLPMYYFEVQGSPLENVPDALAQMGNSWVIMVAVMCNSLSISFFNSCGVCITKHLSASHRMVLDSVRTLVVWTASLAIGWETFNVLQLVGFVILALGTAMYNEIIRVPAVFYYPQEQNPSHSFCDDHGSFLGGVAEESAAKLDVDVALNTQA